MNWSDEQVKKAGACKTIEEFKDLAKKEGYDFSDEQAEEYFQATRKGKLSDDDLDAVAGGKGEKYKGYYIMDFICPFCGETIHFRSDRWENTHEDKPKFCTCGAEVDAYNGTETAYCIKNGTTRRAVVTNCENHF